MSYTHLLFDADNTLFDFDASENFALQQVFTSLQIPFLPEYVDVYHRVNKWCWTAFEKGELEQAKIRSLRFELLLKELDQAVDNSAAVGDSYLQHLAISKFMIEGARDVLEELQHTHQLVIVTNGLKEVQRARLEQNELTSYFEAIIVSDEIGVSKPHSAFFDHTFEQIGHPRKEDVIIIGDSLSSDIKGGHNFGIDTCWYNPRQQSNTSATPPTYEISDIQQVKAVANKNFPRR